MKQKKFVLDAYPLLVFFKKQKNWDFVSEIITEAMENKVYLSITTINLGEIYYNVLKELGKDHAEKTLNAIYMIPISIIDSDWELTKQAAIFKSKGGISYADCFAGALAKREKATLVTGDNEFQLLENEIEILWI